MIVDDDLDGSVEREQCIGQENLRAGRDVAGETEGAAIKLCGDVLTFHRGAFGQAQPVEAMVDHIILKPDDLFRPRVALEFRHPRQALGILEFHPVPKTRVNAGQMDVSAWIGLVESGDCGGFFNRHLVAVHGSVVFPHEDGEGQVAKAEQGSLVRVAGHHRGGGETVRHARGELPDTIAAGGVAHQIDFVRVHAAQADHAFDEAREERIDVLLMPHVPCVGRRAGRDVDPFLRLIETDLVLPLLGVDAGGRLTAAVHRDPQRASVRRGVAEGFLQPWHRLVAVGDRLGGEFRLALFLLLREHRFVNQTHRAGGVRRGKRRVLISEAGSGREIGRADIPDVAALAGDEGGGLHRLGIDFKPQTVGFSRRNGEARRVVEIRGAGLGFEGADDEARLAGQRASHDRPGVALEKADADGDIVRGILFRVASGDVHTTHGLTAGGPDHRENPVIALPGGGVNGVERVVSMRLRGVIGEPTVIQTLVGEFVRSGELPFLIPYLDPGVIAAFIPPHRRADRARRDADGAAGIHEND